MEYKEAFAQYKKEHPEERRGVEILLERSRRFEEARSRAREEKLALIEECRRKLNGSE